MGNKKQSGGSDPIDPAQAYGQIFDIFQKKVIPGYRKFVRGERILQPLRRLAEQGVAELPGLQRRITQGFEAGEGYIPQAVDWLQDQYASRVPTQRLTGPLMGALNYLTPVLSSGGTLTAQETRRATQEAASRNAAAGMATSSPGLFAEALNRDVFRQNRFGNAVSQALNLTSGISGLDVAGLNTALAAGQGLTGYGNELFQRPLRYALGMQGLRGSVMQDLAGAEAAQTQNFATLFNPTAAGVGSAQSFNANASLARENANDAKKQNTTGALLSVAGSVAVAY